MSGRRTYDRAHVKARQAALEDWRPGDVCGRCQHPTHPGSQRLDLDHDDDTGEYRGLAHSSPCPVCGRRCNQQAGGELAARMAGKRPRQRRCEVCNMPYKATSGSSGAVQRTCGQRACVGEIRRRDGEPGEAGPIVSGGRVW